MLENTLYDRTKFQIKDTKFEKGRIFETTCGVRQRSPESATLFNIYLNYVKRIFTDICRNENISFKFKYSFYAKATLQDRNRKFAHKESEEILWLGHADEMRWYVNQEQTCSRS